jgi:hypothetical protein
MFDSKETQLTPGTTATDLSPLRAVYKKARQKYTAKYLAKSLREKGIPLSTFELDMKRSIYWPKGLPRLRVEKYCELFDCTIEQLLNP